MGRRSPLAIAALAALLGSFAPAHAAPGKSPAASDPFDQSQLRALEWRNIGPSRGGRVTAVTGVPGQRNLYYFGGTGSGVWRSTDSGHTWSNLSDGWFGAGSVGAVAVAPSDPNVIWAGMGEACIRGNLSQGDGVYRSTDAGRTWKHVGLADTRQIGRVRVDPRDPDVAYVAALGHVFGPNAERGVFRTRDGGATWKKVLFVNDSTGCVDLCLDPRNPRTLYAGFWQTQRTPWSLSSGGAGSGLWKSNDGGDTWVKLDGKGLPKGVWGRVGVTVSPVNTDRVWAAIEAAEGGVFRSDDAGRTWTRTSEDRDLRQRAWYYTHLFADPKNVDQVYVLNVNFMRSKDGGRTFQRIRSNHGDNHDLWIDPDDPDRMVLGDDGGAEVTTDGGLSWTSLDNQPTAQFYHVVVDDQFPYHVYGAQQDNSTVGIASRTPDFRIDERDWTAVGGGESGFIAPKPGDPNIVYAGSYDGYLSRLDLRTGQQQNINPWPDNPMGAGAESARYRFQWTFPIVASPHDPNTIYAGSNVLHRSRDEGHSWQVISPDLTRHDPAKQVSSGGPITQDNTSVEYYCTIFAMAESPIEKDVLWVGSDDGLVHLSRNGGETWEDVTPRSLPAWSCISQIDVSSRTKGTAYVAAYRYKSDDAAPMAYMTSDYGRTWRSIAGDLPRDGGFVRVVRADPVRAGLLYCGTETGAYFSIDDGAHWRPLRVARPGRIADLDAPDGERKGALPLVPITDMVIKDNDLVVSTQGRAFWILDDLAPLRQMTPAAVGAPSTLYVPSPAYQFGGPAIGGVGSNPAPGAWIYFRLAKDPNEKEEVKLEILDAAGKLVHEYSTKDKDGEGGGGGEEGRFGRRAPKLTAKAGLNKFVWDFRHPEPTQVKGMILWGGSLDGPKVTPGRYQARLTVGGNSQTVPFEVRKDPRLTTSEADYQARFDLLTRIRDHLTAAHDAILTIRDVRDQLKDVADRSKTASKDTTIAASAKALTKKLTAIEEALYQTKNRSGQDPLNFPIRLNNKLSILADVVESADAPPTQQAVAVYDEVSAKIDEQLDELKKALDTDLAAFNQLVRDREVPAVVVKPKKSENGDEAPRGGSPR